MNQAMMSQMQLGIQAQLVLRQNVQIGREFEVGALKQHVCTRLEAARQAAMVAQGTADRVAAEAAQREALARRELDAIRAELASSVVEVRTRSKRSEPPNAQQSLSERQGMHSGD